MSSIRSVTIGGIVLGAGAPVALQSMTTTDTRDREATAAQVHALASAGCDMVRVAVPDRESADAIRDIRRLVPGVPLIADCHFDWRVAVRVAPWVDKVRVNPGTMRGHTAFDEVARAVRDTGVALRVGVNAGSLPGRLRTDPRPLPERLCDAAGDWARRLEEAGVERLVLSVKTSSVPDTIAAYRMLAKTQPHPLHVGLTEAGTVRTGSIRSSVTIGALLAEGIGDTVRISLAGDPMEEVRVGLEVLRCLGLRPRGGFVAACPTCARARIDVAAIAVAIEPAAESLHLETKVAVMGCEVNGPGEARDAAMAIVGTPGGAALYRKGRAVFRGEVTQTVERMLDCILRQVDASGRG